MPLAYPAARAASLGTRAGFDPARVPGLVEDLDAKRIAGLSHLGAVATWPVLVGTAATQGTGAAQPIYRQDGALGHPFVRFDGVTHYMTLPSFTMTASSRSCFALVAPPSTGTSKYFLDAQTGRFLFAFCTSADSQVGWFAGIAFASVGAAAAGLQVLSWILPAAGTGEVFRNGTSVGTSAYTATAIGGAVAFGSAYDGTGPVALDLYRLLIYDNAVGTGNRQYLERGLGGLGGLVIA